ncbi:hypothetical protein Tco_0275763 [Tanacetum coccineum]
MGRCKTGGTKENHLLNDGAYLMRTEQSSVVTDGLIHSAGSPAANHQRFFATRIRVALTSGSTQEPEKSQHDPPTVVPQVVAVKTLMQQIS